MPRRTPRRAPDDTEGSVTTLPRTGKRPSGRTPVVADPQIVDRMLAAVRAGVPVVAACEANGISTSAHGRAMDSGRQAAELLEKNPTAQLTERQELYRAYREQVTRARATVAVVHVAMVGKAAEGGQLISETVKRYRNDDGQMVTETSREYSRPDWRASRFLLERTFRDDFGVLQRQQVELTGANGGPVKVAGEDVLQTIAARVKAVQEQQARELPGGWDRDDYIDGEVVDDQQGESA